MKYTNYSLSKNTYIKARIGWQGLTTAEYLETGNYYLVTGTDIKNGYINFSDCVFVSQNRYSQDVHIQLRLDDVLISKDGTIGKVAYINNLPLPATLNSGVFLIRVDNNVLTQKYFYYLLQSTLFKSFINQTSAGSTITHLYQKDIVKFSFDIPKVIGMQHHIVNIMESIDSLIIKLEKEIKKLNNTLLGIVNQLFKEEKEMVALSNYINVQNGYAFSSGYFTETGNKIVRIGDIKNGTVELGECVSYPSSIVIDNSFVINKGNILMAMSGATTGKVGVYDYDEIAYNNQRVAKITSIRNNTNEFKYIYYYFLSSIYKKELTEILTAGAQPNISATQIKNLKINKFVDDNSEKLCLMESISNRVGLLKTKLKKYINIREGLLNGLFTGKIDVPENYEEV